MRSYGTVALDRAKRTWFLQTSADCATRAKRIFPRIPEGAQGTLPLADNPRNAAELRWFLQRFPHEMSESDRRYLDQRADGQVEQESLVDKILAAGYVPPTFPLLKPLRQYQALAVDLCLKSGALLVADDMGLGKTLCGIGLLTDARALPALIVCPTHLPSHWRDKIAEFMGDRALVHLLTKGTPYDLVERCGRMPDVIISNYHKLSGWAQTLAEIVNSVIYDECLAADTMVQSWPIDEAKQVTSVRAGDVIASFNDRGHVVPDRVVAVVPKGPREVWRLTLDDGRALECTSNERLLTEAGWAYAAEVIDVCRDQYPPIQTYAARGDGAPSLRSHAVVAVEYVGLRDVWDVETERHHTLIANGFAVHNCQDLRHPETRKYEAALYLRDRVDFRLGNSGTPIYNYGNEIHAVMGALREDCLGTKEEFAREWCDGAVGRKAKVSDTGALNAHLRREGLMVRRRKKEVGRELPALTGIVHVIDSDGEARAEAEASIAALAEALLAKGGRGIDKMQAAAEFDMRLRQLTGIDKAPFVANFVRMLAAEGQRVLVFAWHRAVYDILLEKLGPGQLDEDGGEIEDLHPVLYTGSEDTKRKEAAHAAFIAGESRVLIMSLRSGAGVDGLQHVCSTVVFAEIDWSPQVMDQCVCRAHRDGQKDPVFSYTLLSSEGSDPVVADVLGVKAGQFEGLFNPSEENVEDAQAQVGRVKILAQRFLEQRKEKKARPAEPPNPKANAPENLRPVVKPPPKPPPAPKPPALPAPDRWVTLQAKQLTPAVEQRLLAAGIGLSPATVQKLRIPGARATVGFAGDRIVAVRMEGL